MGICSFVTLHIGLLHISSGLINQEHEWNTNIQVPKSKGVAFICRVLDSVIMGVWVLWWGTFAPLSDPALMSRPTLASGKNSGRLITKYKCFLHNILSHRTLQLRSFTFTIHI
jgi:hypothetical protein